MSDENSQSKVLTKEIFSDIELSCTRIKKDIYHIRTQVQQLHFDPQVENNLLEHIDKIYGEFDSMQTFCKSRT